eukprot:TRINITY_DN11269_c0_g1_i1.p1 TRINITY_DN11269_c0_g1~~TRINITY_DN11269_c0_g1_i1.p1  ORF type:complete len:195 (-),score=76.78 TRINITY_DN11269_c0_g1_i1:346-930(-)
MMNIQRPLFSHFHNEMKQNSNNFTILEDHIIVPTPRKVRNLNSPIPKRKNTQENVLFGDAGQELHTILFQGSDSSDTETSEEEILEIIEMRTKHEQQRGVFDYPQHQFSLHSPKFQREFEGSPPVRSSNPLTLNSPFGYSENVLPQMRFVNSVIGSGKKGDIMAESPHSDGENHAVRRYRSSSWPAVSSLVTSE